MQVQRGPVVLGWNGVRSPVWALRAQASFSDHDIVGGNVTATQECRNNWFHFGDSPAFGPDLHDRVRKEEDRSSTLYRLTSLLFSSCPQKPGG